jgi:hypothetical protein
MQQRARGVSTAASWYSACGDRPPRGRGHSFKMKANGGSGSLFLRLAPESGATYLLLRPVAPNPKGRGLTNSGGGLERRAGLRACSTQQTASAPLGPADRRFTWDQPAGGAEDDFHMATALHLLRTRRSALRGRVVGTARPFACDVMGEFVSSRHEPVAETAPRRATASPRGAAGG